MPRKYLLRNSHINQWGSFLCKFMYRFFFVSLYIMQTIIFYCKRLQRQDKYNNHYHNIILFFKKQTCAYLIQRVKVGPKQ